MLESSRISSEGKIKNKDMMRRFLLVLLMFAGLAVSATERQDNADYKSRRIALARMLNGGMLLLFAPTESDGPNNLYGFRQEDNFYYLTGWAEPGAAVLITSSPYSEIFFLADHNAVQEKWTGPKLGPNDPQAAQVTGFDKVTSLDKIHDELFRVLGQNRILIYSDLGENAQSSPSTAPLDWLRRSNSFPSVGFRDAKPLLARLRMIKDGGELRLITRAVEASEAAHLAALKVIRSGITEREISALMQYEFGKRGCERPAYAPIVGSGFYSTVLHYSLDSGTLQNGDLVLMDVAGEYSMYASDITRTAPVHGNFTARQREIYDIVLGAQQEAIKAFQAGRSRLSRSTDHDARDK